MDIQFFVAVSLASYNFAAVPLQDNSKRLFAIRPMDPSSALDSVTSTFPPEIWMAIGGFLIKDDLIDLMSLNSIFLSLAMDKRYKDVVIHVDRESGIITDYLVDRISDPFVAKRVEHLSFFFHDRPDSEALTSLVDVRDSRMQRLRKDLGRALKPFKTFISASRSDKIPNSLKSLNRLSFVRFDKIKMISIFSSSEWPSDVNSFLPLIWPLVGSKLHTLSLDLRLEQFWGLIKSTRFLTQLKELQLFQLSSQGTSLDPAIMIDLASFINSLGPHLEALLMASGHMMDISNALARVSTLPCLTQLSMDLVIPISDVQNASGVKQFLHQVSHTLQVLTLQIVPVDIPFLVTGVEASLKQFFDACKRDDKCFAQLRSLTLIPTLFDVDVDILLGFIQCASRSLEDLTIHAQDFNQDDAKRLSNILSSCRKLSSLDIRVYSISITLLSDLAMGVPSLQKLSLYVRATKRRFNYEHSELTDFLRTPKE